MSFVKVAFWLSLILFLLPTNSREKNEFYGTAQKSMSDLNTFCLRNAELCETTNSIFDTVYQKFVTATEMLEEMLHNAGFGGSGEQSSQDGASPQAKPRPQQHGRVNNGPRPATTSSVSQDTLTGQDLRPNWNGPSSASGTVAYRSKSR